MDWKDLVPDLKSIVVASILIGIALTIWHYVSVWRARRRLHVDERHKLDPSLHRTGAALAAALTFIVPLAWTAIQFALTQQSEQRRQDKDYLKGLGEIFSTALTTYEKRDGAANLRIQAIYELERAAVLASQTTISSEATPFYYVKSVSDLLMREIRSMRSVQEGKTPDMYVSRECGTKKEQSSPAGTPQEIDKLRDKHYLVQAALGSLGRLRAKVDFPVRLYGVQLDNMDLKDGDFTGADLSHSYLRLTDLSKSKFEEANFRGAVFSDELVPGWTEKVGGEWKKLYYGDEWMKLYCWVADFRGAKLANADFRDARLEGADFRGATFSTSGKKAVELLQRATISRADFRETNITQDQICGATWTPGHEPTVPDRIFLKSCPQAKGEVSK
jgi:Pentapeptide repeats (8 copies)